MRPLTSDEEYGELKRLSREFSATVGRKLQRFLWVKWALSSNYVSDWWEEYVYLAGRVPLPVNSNYYTFALPLFVPTRAPAARAATIVSIMLHFRALVHTEALRPIRVQRLVPLCSAQYERFFNTTRVPAMGKDMLVHATQSDHIVVYHKGGFFKLLVETEEHQLTSLADLQLYPSPPPLPSLPRATTRPLSTLSHL